MTLEGLDANLPQVRDLWRHDWVFLNRWFNRNFLFLVFLFRVALAVAPIKNLSLFRSFISSAHIKNLH